MSEGRSTVSRLSQRVNRPVHLMEHGTGISRRENSFRRGKFIRTSSRELLEMPGQNYFAVIMTTLHEGSTVSLAVLTGLTEIQGLSHSTDNVDYGRCRKN